MLLFYHSFGKMEMLTDKEMLKKILHIFDHAVRRCGCGNPIACIEILVFYSGNVYNDIYMFVN